MQLVVLLRGRMLLLYGSRPYFKYLVLITKGEKGNLPSGFLFI